MRKEGWGCGGSRGGAVADSINGYAGSKYIAQFGSLYKNLKVGLFAAEE